MIRVALSTGHFAGLCLILALPSAALAEAPARAMYGPPAPVIQAPAPSLAHPTPPNLAPVAPGTDIETTNPVLAPSPVNRKDDAVGSVTCFACPGGQNTYRGAICMNGVACAAEGVTLQQLNIGLDKNNTAVTTALRKLESARAELVKLKGPSRTKALQYLNNAVSELKTAGLKAGCKGR